MIIIFKKILCFFLKTILLIKGAANSININANLDLCLIPVPKFPTPIPKTKI